MPPAPLALLASTLIFLSGCASNAATQDPAEAKAIAPETSITSIKDLYRWMLWYYEDPQPQLTVPAIRFMADNRMLPSSSSTIPTFLSAVFRQNRAQIAPWLGQFDGLDSPKRQTLLAAAWLSDTEEAQAYLRAVAAADPEMRDGIGQLLAEKPPDLLSTAMPSASSLDMLWANYLATGDRRYVQQVIRALPKHDAATSTEKDPELLLSGGMAKWSLTSNAQQHPSVLSICREELERVDPAVRLALQSIVDQAEKGAVGKEEVLAEVEKMFRNR